MNDTALMMLQRFSKLIDQFLYTADWNEKVRIQDGSIATVFTLSAESATPQVLFPLLESLPTMPHQMIITYTISHDLIIIRETLILT